MARRQVKLLVGSIALVYTPQSDPVSSTDRLRMTVLFPRAALKPEMNRVTAGRVTSRAKKAPLERNSGASDSA
jgi:hypothetical protein